MAKTITALVLADQSRTELQEQSLLIGQLIMIMLSKLKATTEVSCWYSCKKYIQQLVITELIICIINYISFGSFSNRFVVNKVS